MTPKLLTIGVVAIGLYFALPYIGDQLSVSVPTISRGLILTVAILALALGGASVALSWLARFLRR